MKKIFLFFVSVTLFLLNSISFTQTYYRNGKVFTDYMLVKFTESVIDLPTGTAKIHVGGIKSTYPSVRNYFQKFHSIEFIDIADQRRYGEVTLFKIKFEEPVELDKIMQENRKS